MGITAAKSITINAYTAIANPQVEVDKFKVKLDSAKLLTDKPELASYKSVINGFEKVFNDEYAKLSDEEKKEVAYILKRQAANIEEAQLKSANTTAILKTNALKTFDAGDIIFAHGKVFVTCVVGAVIAGEQAVIWLSAPEPTFVSKVIGAGMGITSFGLFLKAFNSVDKFLDIAAFEVSVDGFSDITRGQEIAPIKVNALNPHATNATFTFSPKLAAVTCTATATVGSLSLTNKTSTVSGIATIFTHTDKLQNIYNSFRSAVTWARKYISALPEVPEFAYPIPAAPKKTAQQIAPSANFTIENVSNAKIKVAITGSGEKITLRTTTTDSIKTDIDFTFDLVYKNAKLGTTLRKTITANYNGAPASLVGTWMAVSDFEQQSENGVVLREYHDTYRPNALVVVISATQLKVYEEGVLEDTFNYTLAGNKITYLENGKSNTRTIKSLNDIQMILTFDDPKTANGINYNEHIETTYVRQP